MQTLTYTFIGDGSSDKALMNIINWLINDLYPKLPVKSNFADFRNLKNPPKKGDVVKQIKYAKCYFPYDFLIYHRDAEVNTGYIIDKRKEEIFSQLTDNNSTNNIICVVPIVMMESWLLIDELSIKKAAENINFSGDIDLPAVNKIEAVKEPKEFLHNLLKKVSEKKKRSLKEFNTSKAVHIVAENIQDFSKLRNLSSFKIFETDLKDCIKKFILNHGT